MQLIEASLECTDKPTLHELSDLHVSRWRCIKWWNLCIHECDV